MKFINRLSHLAIREDNSGMRALLTELAHDPGTSSAQLRDFGFVADSENFYLFVSSWEVALIFIDTEGLDGEFADEDNFISEIPRWYQVQKHSERPSPLARLKSIMKDFMAAMRAKGHADIDNYVSVLITNSTIGNFRNDYDVLSADQSVVFQNVKDIKIPMCPNGGKAQSMVDEFREYCNHPEKPESEDESFNKLIDSFFQPKEEESVNTTSGKKTVEKKNTELPAVTILEPIEDPKQLLEEMVGLGDLKQNIAEIVAYANYSKRLRRTFPQLPRQPINLHTIIVGNPGTGKTTMCRIYGGLLHSAGILSRGHTVMATRSSFVGEYFGTEEKRVNECLKMAQGGCLFIDEAAQLFTNPHPHDPGRNVIQLMLQLLAEEDNRDIAVVLALYGNDKSLERLYELNPGIKSRFVNVLRFPDYTLDELFEIARRKVKAQGLTFTPKAWHKFCEALAQMYACKDANFANGREVVNLLQRCVINLALRCEKNYLNGLDLLRLTVQDIPDVPAPIVINRKLGFT